MIGLTRTEPAISDKGISIICHGFNEHFEVPKIDGKVKATFRTAIVIKKRDFYDEWDVYDNLAWRVINGVAKALSASMQIDCPEPSEEHLSSFEELRQWQDKQSQTDPDFALEPPTQIRFYAKKTLLCLMSLEDWSDIWTIEPYLGSFTFSFYSYDSEINAKVTEAITNQLEAEPEISEVRTVYEATAPKWYWAITREYSLKAFIKDVVIGMIVIALSLVLSISCCSDKSMTGIRSDFDAAGLTELPYGFEAFYFSTPPVKPPFPRIAKNPTLFLINNRQASVRMTPVRSDNGKYSLVVHKSGHGPAEDTTLCVLTGETGADNLHLTENGIVTDGDGPWKCALFLSKSGKGVVAWKGEPEDGTWLIDSPDGTKSVLRAKPSNGYRRFKLYQPFWWSENCTPSAILHEIWTDK